MPSKPGVVGSILGFYSLSDETLNRGAMTIFQDKLLTRTDCDEAGDYMVPNMLSLWNLVFRPDIGHKLFHHLGERTGLVVRASDSGSGDPGSILGRVGVLFP